jgi:hypothetical protein
MCWWQTTAFSSNCRTAMRAVLHSGWESRSPCFSFFLHLFFPILIHAFVLLFSTLPFILPLFFLFLCLCFFLPLFISLILSFYVFVPLYSLSVHSDSLLILTPEPSQVWERWPHFLNRLYILQLKRNSGNSADFRYSLHCGRCVGDPGDPNGFLYTADHHRRQFTALSFSIKINDSLPLCPPAWFSNKLALYQTNLLFCPSDVM